MANSIETRVFKHLITVFFVFIFAIIVFVLVYFDVRSKNVKFHKESSIGVDLSAPDGSDPP